MGSSATRPKKKVSRLIGKRRFSSESLRPTFREANGEADKQVSCTRPGTAEKRLKDRSVKMFLTDPRMPRSSCTSACATCAVKLQPGGLCLAYADPGRLPKFSMRCEAPRFLWCLRLAYRQAPLHQRPPHPKQVETGRGIWTRGFPLPQSGWAISRGRRREKSHHPGASPSRRLVT